MLNSIKEKTYLFFTYLFKAAPGNKLYLLRCLSALAVGATNIFFILNHEGYTFEYYFVYLSGLNIASSDDLIGASAYFLLSFVMQGIFIGTIVGDNIRGKGIYLISREEKLRHRMTGLLSWAFVCSVIFSILEALPVVITCIIRKTPIIGNGVLVKTLLYWLLSTVFTKAMMITVMNMLSAKLDRIASFVIVFLFYAGAILIFSSQSAMNSALILLYPSCHAVMSVHNMDFLEDVEPSLFNKALAWNYSIWLTVIYNLFITVITAKKTSDDIMKRDLLE